MRAILFLFVLLISAVQISDAQTFRERLLKGDVNFKEGGEEEKSKPKKSSSWDAISKPETKETEEDKPKRGGIKPAPENPRSEEAEEETEEEREEEREEESETKELGGVKPAPKSPETGGIKPGKREKRKPKRGGIKTVNKAKETETEEAAPAKLPDIAPQPNIDYTYATDRKYEVVHELNNQFFLPSEVIEGNDSPYEVAPGDVLIRLTSMNIQIKGIEGLDILRINNKYKDKVGFVYEVYNTHRDIAKLKIVVDQDNFVNLLYFYSKEMGEYTFLLKERSREELSRMRTHFTSKSELMVRGYDQMIDHTFVPYSIVKQYKRNNFPEPIQIEDNIEFSFKEKEVRTPVGTFRVKKAKTFAFKLEGYPGIRAMTEISLKDTKYDKMFVFLNFKQNIEIIQIGDHRYFLMP